MTRICHEKTGLFPAPAEIKFTCSCPDWAGLCKHVAATLYGIGARLDEKPELMFTLRQVDAQDLIAQAGADLSKANKKGRSTTKKVLAEGNLSEIFGIELQAAAPAAATSAKGKAKTAVPMTRSKVPAKKKKPAVKKRAERRV